MRLAKLIGITAALAASLTVTVQEAAATLITSLEGPAISLPATGYFGNQPQQVASGITWSSTASSAVFGYSGAYGFAANGMWSGLTMSGLNSAAGTMTFGFDTPVNAVGGYLNYAPKSGVAPTIAVYDAAMHLLESATLSFSTGGALNSGEFFGFLGNDDISFFALSGAFIGITDLTVAGNRYSPVLETSLSLDVPQELPAPVPEPSTFVLFGAGLLGVCLLKKRRLQG